MTAVQRGHIVVTDAHAHTGTKEETRERIQDGIMTMICAGEPEDAKRLDEILKWPGAIQTLVPAAGLHPWNSGKTSVEDMMPFMEKYPVIGEIGMDTLWCDVPVKVQREAFERQLAFAMEQKKPAVLHTKAQEKEIARILRDYPNRYLVHWYSCSRFLDEYLEQDCYVSIGPDVVWNPAVQEAARRVPKNRILAETDGLGAVEWALKEGEKMGIKNTLPSAAPVRPVGASLEQTIKCSAGLRGMDPADLAIRIRENMIRFLSNGIASS